MKLNVFIFLPILALCIVGFSGTSSRASSMAGNEQDGFYKSFTIQGIAISVSVSGNGQLQVIADAGGEPLVQEQQINGRVLNAEVEDMNGNGLPEILIYVSEGYQGYGKVIAYSMYSRRSMGQVYFPGIRDNPSASQGYMGGDEFSLVENTLVQRFPIYRNGQRTGQMRQIQWQMVMGENSPAFRIANVNEVGGAAAGQYGNQSGGQYGNQGGGQSNFYRSLSFEGVTFDINASGNGMLTIRAYGLQGDDDVAEHQVYGKNITGAEVADLDGNGSPEVFVYLTSGNQSYGEVIAYSVLGRSAMVQVYFPGVQNNQAVNNGYMGYDEFAIVENRLVQRFPIFQYGRRSGKSRRIEWQMVRGENSPVFRVGRVTEF